MHQRKDLNWKVAVEAKTPLLSPNQGHYLRITWVNESPNWLALSPEQIFIRSAVLTKDVERVVLLVDSSIIGLN